jgi:3-hydroxybutyryl-CoA dehydrogenase
MGSGIAQLAVQSGFDVMLFDINNEVLSKSETLIKEGLQRLVEKEKISSEEKTEILQRLTFTSLIEHCIADVIIEAVAEDMIIKQKLFDELFRLNKDNTIFTTNTSSISVTALSDNKKYASRLAGMHFFNPAPLMKLVEIIRGEKTSEILIETLARLAKQLGKTPVICNDAPGFIVNRIARPYYLEALQLLQTNMADITTIDRVMEATGFKMGPFKLMDLIGIDVNYSVSNIVWEALGKPERLAPSVIQKEKVEAKELGRKTGKGFYKY